MEVEMRDVARIVLAATLVTLSAGVADAGDAAELKILGFAQGGRIFAFEEHGVQDGSGFPYANRFYIDTATDKFLPGTPIRARIDDDTADLSRARSEAAAAGDKILPDREFSPGFTAAFNAITEQSADPLKLVALPRPIFPPMERAVGIRLEEIDVPGPENCESIGPVKGFRLIRFDPETNADVTLLHKDTRVPESRNCPTGYRLGGLQTDAGNGVMAVLIIVEGAGFEGPNHRWLAVTGKL
jgi:predicted secreted protein